MGFKAKPISHMKCGCPYCPGIDVPPPQDLKRALTPREIDVLRGLAHGLTYQELADHLELSVSTVKNHITPMFAKLGIRSSAQAAIYAIRNGII